MTSVPANQKENAFDWIQGGNVGDKGLENVLPYFYRQKEPMLLCATVAGQVSMETVDSLPI